MQVQDYMEGPLDSSWRQVTIPLKDLVTDAYDMHTVDYVKWPNMRGGVYFVDAIVLGTASGRIPGAAPLSQNTTLRGMARSDSNDLVAVGDGGVLLQLDARNVSWEQRALPAAVSAAQTDLLAVWLSSTDSWVVGAASTVLRCPTLGGECVAAAVPAGVTGTLRGVSGVEESTAYVQKLDLWVVGDAGLVLHSDGRTWVEQSSGTEAGLRGVFAITTTDVWTCGDNGVLLHYDGGNWSARQSGTTSTLHSVWAAGATSVWVCGDSGTLLFCNGGSTCERVAVPTTAALYAVAGSREYDVFVVGEGGVAIYKHWSGEWRMAGCTSSTACDSISPHGADLFAAAAGGVCVFYGTERVGAGADGGSALELAGDHWHRPALKLYCGTGPRRDLCDQNVLRFHIRRSSDGPDPLYPTVALSTWNIDGPYVSVADFLDTGTHVDGTWRQVTIPLTELSTPDWRLWNVETVRWGNTSAGCGNQRASVLPSSCQQFMVSGLEAIHEEGTPDLCAADDALREGLPARIPPSTTNRTIRGVARAVGGSCASPRPMMMVECKRDVQLWACGDGGYLAHTDAVSMDWVVDASPVDSALHDIVVLSPTEMWACGAGGVMLNGNGQEWVEWSVPVPSDINLFALEALKRDQVWAVGDRGTLLFFDGATWTVRHLGTTRNLRGVGWYPGDDYLGYPLLGVVVGDGGAIYKSRDPTGGGWTAVDHSLTNLTLHSVTVPSHTDAWAVGDGGILLHFDGTDWAWVDSGTDADLYVVDAYRSGAILAAGASGTILWYAAPCFEPVLKPLFIRGPFFGMHSTSGAPVPTRAARASSSIMFLEHFNQSIYLLACVTLLLAHHSPPPTSGITGVTSSSRRCRPQGRTCTPWQTLASASSSARRCWGTGKMEATR